jgi:flavin reductase (DIM6/NTAB) family NADH-FMN oxidoreductase RutF
VSAAVDIHGFEKPSDDPAVLRAAFGRFPSGVAALSAEHDGVKSGLVATSFSVGVSFDPPLVMFSVQDGSTTWPVLRRSERIGVSILGSGQAAACLQLASRKGDRFVGLETMSTGYGSLFVSGSAVFLDCSIISETPAGDHHIVILEVHALKVHENVEPLVYHGAAFRELVAV